MKVGFVGLGAMGGAMAANLLKGVQALTVYNRTQEKAEPLVARGAVLARTPAEAARGDIVISMLADDAAVQAVVFGGEGLLAALPPGAIHISMSTISFALAERLATAHRQARQHFVSAPVFGRPAAAAAAKLFIVAARKPKRFPRASHFSTANLRNSGRSPEGNPSQAQRQFPDRLGDRVPRRGVRSDEQSRHRSRGLS